MNINRNNYEEYFLLYADNELTDSEKAEVLMFLKENKDLESEFRMIHHTICKPDASIALGDKSFLLKGDEAPVINEKNYEEVFVLYHDNELSDKQKKQTEDFLTRHAQLKNEFELIGLARLIPEDAVVFPNKRLLYRKERGRVVPVIFWRALAAAIFIGCGLWATQLYLQKGRGKSSLTVRSIPVKQIAPVPEKKPVNTIVQSPARNAKPAGTEIIPGKEKSRKPLSHKNGNVLVKASVKKQPGEVNLTNRAPEKINSDGKITNEVVNANEKIKNISKDQITGNNAVEPSKELTGNALIKVNEVQPVMNAQSTSYVSDANDNTQNYVFYDVTSEEFKKTKVSGFLKKVKRIISRNNPISRLISGDDRQVVSN